MFINKPLRLIYISCLLGGGFCGVHALQPKKKKNAVAAKNLLNDWSPKSKKEREKLLTKKSTSKLFRKKMIITSTVVFTLIIILYLLIRRYRKNRSSSTGTPVVGEERFANALRNVVYYSSDLNLADFREVRESVSSEILNSSIFPNNTTALEYAIIERASQKTLALLIDKERASQHTVKVTLKAFQEAILAIVTSAHNNRHQEQYYLLEALLPNLTANLLNQVMLTSSIGIRGGTRTALDTFIEELYVDYKESTMDQTPNKKKCYQWIVSALLSQSHLSDLQLPSTEKGFKRSVELAFIDDQYTPNLEKISQEIDGTNFTKTFFGMRGGGSNAVEAAIINIAVLKSPYNPQNYKKLKRTIKVADILLKHKVYPEETLTDLFFNYITDKIQTGFLNQITEQEKAIDELLLHLLEKMSQQSSNEVVNQAVQHSLDMYSYSPSNEEATKAMRKRVLVALLTKNNLEFTPSKATRLESYQL